MGVNPAQSVGCALSSSTLFGSQFNELEKKGLAVLLALLLHGGLVAALLMQPSYELPAPLAVEAFEFVLWPVEAPPEPEIKRRESKAVRSPAVKPLISEEPTKPPIVQDSVPPAFVIPRRREVAEITPIQEEVPEQKNTAVVADVPEKISKKKVSDVVERSQPQPSLASPTKRVPGRESFVPVASLSPSLNNPKPRYPILARRRGWQGLVLLRVEVDATGAPLAVQIKQGSGYSILDDSAMRTVKNWRFIPAKRGGVAVRAFVEVPIHFSLVNPKFGS
ncbi:MAG: energy transducer TonB [Magnetococcales bacterium]|nr:energy transducer TonB [Magnetococcales bacterium]